MTRFTSLLVVLAATFTACGEKGSPMCEERVDEAPAMDVPIRIRNAGTADVFLASDCELRRWRIRRADSSPNTSYPAGTCEPLSCEAPPDDDCRQECMAVCEGMPPVRIIPGGVFEVGWPQLLREFVDRETECGVCGCVATSPAVACVGPD